MRYVFICSDTDFLKIQYSDFGEPDKGLVLLNRKRRFFSLLSIIGITKLRIMDFISAHYLRPYFRSIVEDDSCFIIYSRVYESFRTSLCRFLKKEYPKSRLIVYYGDLISRHRFDAKEVVSEVDEVFTFDEGDANAYEIKWLLEPFSVGVPSMEVYSKENNPIKWDVTFVGHAKNRYERILHLYERLVNLGLKCDFHIIGVPESRRRHLDDIGYEPLDFSTLLQHVVSSKCVVEVMQDDGVSPTTRYTEAMLFEKSLLTDCVFFRGENTNPPNVIYFNRIDDIDDSYVDRIMNVPEFDRAEYCRAFSIETMIDSIDKYMMMEEKNDSSVETKI